jgi:hypothetical protein
MGKIFFSIILQGPHHDAKASIKTSFFSLLAFAKTSLKVVVWKSMLSCAKKSTEKLNNIIENSFFIVEEKICCEDNYKKITIPEILKFIR